MKKTVLLLILIALFFSPVSVDARTATDTVAVETTWVDKVVGWYDENMNYWSITALMTIESSFIPSIQDGSKKVLELHYCKFFRLQYGRKGILGLIDRWRTWKDDFLVRRFDKFVVLTHEDRNYWGKLPNIEVIPNAAKNMSGHFSDVSAHRVIAVGRLDYQKGFDRLVQAWSLVQADGRFADWQLDIFGQGEWKDMLQQMIDSRGLEGTVHINRPTNSIGDEYAKSSLIVMTSNYEGFGMVLVEAMAASITYFSPAGVATSFTSST